MLTLLLMVAVPATALALAFRMWRNGREHGDMFGATLASRTLFPSDVPQQDPGPVVPEEDDPVRFRLD